MANLTKCANGHFFDADKNRTCPYCEKPSSGGDTTPLPQNDGGTNNGIIFENAANRDPLLKSTSQLNAPNARSTAMDTGETVGFYSDMKVSPVVGWLVSIEGSTKGKDFRLISGRNYIGRQSSMDIVLDGDNKVSRSKHAVVLFDPKSQKTLCHAGESRELFYLNDNVVTETVELKQGDIITVGDTKLMFVPFCGALHTWNTAE